MTNVGKSLSTLALIALTSLLLVACGGGGGEGGSGEGGGNETVVVASDIAYRPFEYEEDGEPTGFDIDLMNEIGNRAGFTPEYQNVTFDGIIGGLQGGNYDAAISAMTITEEREEQVDFSDPYFDSNQSLMVSGDSDIQGTDDLADANVGVQLATTGEIEANELREAGDIGEVTTYDVVDDAFAALENGQVDAVIADFPVVADRVNRGGGNLEIAQTIETGEQYGIAFPQDSELTERVNEALAEIKEDGTYVEIYERYFGQEPESIPE
jgi:ABC-type amino acid transport substrate-binding protein